jgi:hypothetical protein
MPTQRAKLQINQTYIRSKCYKVVHLECSSEEVSVPALFLAPGLKVAEEGVELAVGVPLQMPAARFKSVTESAFKILCGNSCDPGAQGRLGPSARVAIG